MEVVHLLNSFLDQHGHEVDITEKDMDKTVRLYLRNCTDMVVVSPSLDIHIYCDFVTYIQDQPQLIVNLYHPKSLQLIAKYLRCISKKNKK